MSDGHQLINSLDLEAGEKLTPIDLHPAHQCLSADGVSGFLMPMNESDADRFCESFMTRVADRLRSRGIDHDRMAEALWLVFISIVFEASSLFYLTRLARRYREVGRAANWGGAEGTIAKIGAGEQPTSSVLRMVLADPSRSRVRSPWARWLASAGRRDGYSRRPPQLLDPKRDAICFVGEQAAHAVAEAESKRLVLTRFDHWIDFDTGWQSRVPNLPSRDILNEVIDIAAETFADADEVMPPQVRASLSETTEMLLRVALKSLSDVEAKSHRLPELFLSGSTGSVHNRAIGRVVQKEGGTVVSFDHGVGGGWRNIPTATITVWDLPHRFITFTETHAAGVNRVMDQRLRVSGVDCKAEASPVPLIPPRSEIQAFKTRPGDRALRIMYVSTLYFGERYYAPRMPIDVAEIDFQTRLLSHLKNNGHDIIIKPHPECMIGVPAEMAELVDAEIETRGFDHVVNTADVLIFDCPSSTTFRTAVCTDVPIVVIDHGCVPITDHALSLIALRAAIVDTGRDDCNRITVDWPSLDQAIEKAGDLCDPAFANQYFGADL